MTKTINGDRFRTLSGFYDEVGRSLVPHRVWGRNLNALREILFELTLEKPLTLHWIHSAKSSVDLGYAETLRVLKMHRKHAPKDHRQVIQEFIMQAHDGKGKTFFDWIVQIMLENKDISLTLD